MTNTKGDLLDRETLLETLNSDALLFDASVVAQAFEVSLDGWYAMVRQGTAPVMPIMVGRRQKYSATDVRRILGIAGGAPEEVR